ncbi:MAG: T9SS type A sorting domain-containing protein [Flavobacteriales bacterium]|nr:T9SS type A sorting domain-containing protein [Flavobacteriales bacterium]
MWTSRWATWCRTIPWGSAITIDLLQGRVMSAPGLRLNPTATATNYTDASFVNGPMTKLGTANFTYPVGKGNALRPAALTGVSGSGSDAFTVEYFAADPTVLFGTPVEPTLDHVSECEYWMIDRDTGTPNATVQLSWDTPESCGVTALADLRVARWSGAIWEDKGQLNVTGNTTAGTLETAAQQTAFSPWTLASTSSQNPLPIELLSFSATAETDRVRLDWTTATERDNAFFTVERSRDANDFEAVIELPGAGTSLSTLSSQAFDNAPLAGTSYYRLRQTDLDGTSTVSAAVPVNFSGSAANGLAVIGTGEVVWLEHDFAPGNVLSILDASGRMVLQIVITEGPRMPLPTAELPAGAYLVRASDGDRVVTTRFIR